MKVLIETRLNALRLNENKQPRKGCLGRIEGVCADFVNPTRNGRKYGLRLWQNVRKSELVEEGLKTNTLLGELDHPEERFDVLAKEACVVMTDFVINESEGTVFGGFDILDTPSGRILKSLLDYGCVMGVSSRGQGDIIDGEDGEEVDPDTYEFACFDVVTTPAVATARQTVTESMKGKAKKLIESIQSQIDDAKTEGDLDTIKRVVESTNLPIVEELTTSIEDKRKSFNEGKTVASQITKDLQEAVNKIQSLEAQLAQKPAKTVRGADTKALAESVKVLRQTVLSLRKENKQLAEENQRLRESSEVEQGNSKELREKLNSVLSDTSTERNLKEAKARVGSLSRQMTVLQEANTSLRGQNTSLMEQVRTANTTISEQEGLISDLRENNGQLSGKVQSLLKEQGVIQQRVNEAVDNLRKQTETLGNYKKYARTLREAYATVKAKSLGVEIDSLDISGQFGKNLSVGQLDKLLESAIATADRYAKLGISRELLEGTSVKTQSIRDNNMSEEDTATEDFLLRAQENF